MFAHYINLHSKLLFHSLCSYISHFHQTKLINTITMFRRKNCSSHADETIEQLQDRKLSELRASLGALSGRNLQYCTDACLKRYLEYWSWNVGKSKKVLEETLQWRSTFKPEEIRWNDVAVECETGKAFRANFHDRLGRSVLILRPGLKNTSAESQLKHLIYLLENSILNLPEGQQQMVWLVDFTGLSLKTNISIKYARETCHILQNHYPERIVMAFLYNPPRLFEAFWKVVKYFVDPKSIHKANFVYSKDKESVEVMRSHFDMDNLPTEFGGKATLQYNHDEFSKQMVNDDVKTANVWGLNKPGPYDARAEAAPEPECLVAGPVSRGITA